MIILARYNYFTTLKGAFLLLLLSSPTYAEITQKIDFHEAVRYALISNPRISASTATIEAANASVTEARGNGLLKLNLEMNAARSNNPLNVFSYKLSQGNAAFADFGAPEYHGPSSASITPSALNSPNYYSNLNTGIVLKIPLYTGGNNQATIKRSNFLLNEAKHGNQAARNELTYDVLQAYEGVHVASALVQIAEQARLAAN